MKKILFVAISATLLAAGCQKTEILNQAGEPSMTFATGAKKLTKASGEEAKANQPEDDAEYNLKAQDFRVWVYGEADFPHTQGNDTQGYDGMLNLEVGYDKESQTWGTEHQHFWPGKTKNLIFYAVSASKTFMEKETSPVQPAAVTETEGLVISDFEIKDQEYNNDLMVADYVKQDQTTTTVNLQFRHALSKVAFYFNTIPAEDINVFVKEVKVKGLQHKGDLSVSYPEKKATFSWTLETGTTDYTDDYEIVYTGSHFPSEIDGKDVVDNDKLGALELLKNSTLQESEHFTTWLVLPQDVSNKSVEITYLMNQRQFVAEFPLAGSNVKLPDSKWNPNQFIKYTVTIAPNLISFNPSVEEWEKATDITDQN